MNINKLRRLIREIIENDKKEIKCPKCGTINSHDAKKCKKCGHDKGPFEKNQKMSERLFERVKKYICPPATQDVNLNTKNRNSTIKNHMYGPLNVKEPDNYWKRIAKKWKTSEKAAKQSLCGNCVAFDISPRMDDCMPGKVSDDSGRLGYCWMHHFKCHSARTCDTWAMGGPITKDEVSHDWQDKNNFKETK